MKEVKAMWLEQLTELYKKIKKGVATESEKREFEVLVETSCMEKDSLFRLLESKCGK